MKRAGKTASSDVSPFLPTRRRSFPPASATTSSPDSAATAYGLLSTMLPGCPASGLFAPSNPEMSATGFQLPLVLPLASHPKD
jgi:hypothetical protein